MGRISWGWSMEREGTRNRFRLRSRVKRSLGKRRLMSWLNLRSSLNQRPADEEPKSSNPSNNPPNNWIPISKDLHPLRTSTPPTKTTPSSSAPASPKASPNLPKNNPLKTGKTRPSTTRTPTPTAPTRKISNLVLVAPMKATTLSKSTGTKGIVILVRR